MSKNEGLLFVIENLGQQIINLKKDISIKELENEHLLAKLQKIERYYFGCKACKRFSMSDERCGSLEVCIDRALWEERDDHKEYRKMLTRSIN